MENCSTIRNVSNKRIADRNLPTLPLQSYLDVRAVPTKYTLLPIIDIQPPTSFDMRVEPTYNSEKTFNPGDRQSPWSGFASNVDMESILRSQIFALQKCSQAVYVPSSTSDLYITHMMEEVDSRRHPSFISYASSPYTCVNQENHPSNFPYLYKNPNENFAPSMPAEMRFSKQPDLHFFNSSRLLR